MRVLSDTQGIFRQLGATSGTGGVRVIIENHAAWVHNSETDASITTALRLVLARKTRDPKRDARIEQQRRALLPLVTHLRQRLSTAS